MLTNTGRVLALVIGFLFVIGGIVISLREEKECDEFIGGVIAGIGIALVVLSIS